MHTTNDIALSDLAPSREAMYRLLSALFTAAPTEPVFSELCGPRFVQQVGSLFSEAVAAPLRECSRAATSDPRARQRVHQEYMNLFKVPGAQYVAPYESVYRDTRIVAGKEVKGLLMGPSAVDVQKWYRLAAARIAAEFKDLPDHIGLELNFLAYLVEKEQTFDRLGEAAKVRRAREIQRDFLARHLVRWVADLQNKIFEKSEHPFYRAVSQLAVEYVRSDLNRLEEALGPTE